MADLRSGYVEYGKGKKIYLVKVLPQEYVNKLARLGQDSAYVQEWDEAKEKLVGLPWSVPKRSIFSENPATQKRPAKKAKVPEASSDAEKSSSASGGARGHAPTASTHPTTVDADMVFYDNMFYWQHGSLMFPVKVFRDGVYVNSDLVKLRRVMEDDSLGKIAMVKKCRLYDDHEGTTPANFSATAAEAVGGLAAEIEPSVHEEHERAKFSIFSMSKENFARMVAGRHTSNIYMASRESLHAPKPPPVIHWTLNEQQKDVKFALCFRKSLNQDDDGNVSDCPWAAKKFGFTLYAKEKSPDIYLALTTGMTTGSEDSLPGSPTWRGFFEHVANSKGKSTSSLLTEVYEGTIANLAQNGFAAMTWAKAKVMDPKFKVSR